MYPIDRRIGTMSPSKNRPRPLPSELIIWIFDGELMRQGDRNFILAILLPDFAGKYQLLPEFRHQHLGQGNDPIFAALGPDEKEGEPFQIKVFDAQIKRLAHAQSTAIKQPGDQVGGITRPIANRLEQRLSFVNRGSMAQARRPFGAERIDILQRLTQNLLIKEQHGVKGLILAAGRQIAVAGEIGQETFQFLLAGKYRWHGIKGGHVMAEPIDVGGFGGEGFMLAADDSPQPFDGVW